jgi:HEAT repeat protein
MSDSKLVQKVIDAYAHDPEGLTREECEGLTKDEDQAQALCDTLGTGAGGFVTDIERDRLASAGFDPDFIFGIAGLHGNHAMRERAKWLGDHVVTKAGRWDFRNKIREEFVRELGRIGPVASSAIPALIIQMKRGNPEAADALVSIGPEAVSALKSELDNEDKKVRRTAAEALVRIGPAAVPELIKAKKYGKDDYRHGAIEVLDRIRPAAIEAVPSLLAVLKDEGERGRHRDAAEILGWLGPVTPEIVPALIEALKSENYKVINALGEIGPEAEEAVPLLVQLVKGSENQLYKDKIQAANMRHAQQRAIVALGKIGAGAKDVVPVLIEKLEGENCYGKKVVVEALGELGPAAKDAVPALIEALRVKGIFVREAAAKALIKIGRAAGDAAPALLKALDDEDEYVRRVAALMLVRIGPVTPEVAHALLAAHEATKEEMLRKRSAAPEGSSDKGSSSARLEAMRELPYEFFQGARFIFTDCGNTDTAGSYMMGLGFIVDIRECSMNLGTITHELAHHWDKALAPERAELFDRISWEGISEDRYLDDVDEFYSLFNKHRRADFDHADFARDYGLTKPDEDLATVVQSYVTNGVSLRSRIRQEMDRGNFELAAKYLFVKHVMPFRGREYGVGNRSSSLTVKEVKAMYFLATDTSKTKPDTYDIILEIENYIDNSE